MDDNNKGQLISKVNNIQVHKRLKLKALKQRRKKSKKNSCKREGIQMNTREIPRIHLSTKNFESEERSNENDLNSINRRSHSNNESDEINENINHTSHSNNESNEINENNDVYNPIEISRELLSWLLQPMDIETFFK